MKPSSSVGTPCSQAGPVKTGFALAALAAVLLGSGCSVESRAASAVEGASLQRVVSLAPSITEILFAIGAGDLLVGRSEYCLFPESACEIENVGRLDQPNLEEIVALKPDLVLASGLTPLTVVGRIEGMGIRARRFDHSGMSGLLDDIRSIGDLVGAAEGARTVVAGMEAAMDAVRRRSAGTERPSAVLLYDLAGLYSAGGGTFPDDLIRLAGGRNIAAGALSAWPQLSLEGLLETDPEVIFVTYGGATRPRDAVERLLAERRNDPVWSRLSALRSGRVYLIQDDYLSIPGPRSIRALEVMSLGLYPAAD